VNYLLVFVGGGAGSVCRYLVGKALSGRPGEFPTATLIVNLVGCIIVGVLFRVGSNMQADSAQRAALIVGFCGGFTTFSAFSLETATMITTGRWGLALGYVATTVIGCLIGTTLILRS
jgi:fluoride exporter